MISTLTTRASCVVGWRGRCQADARILTFRIQLCGPTLRSRSAVIGAWSWSWVGRIYPHGILQLINAITRGYYLE